MMRTSSRKTHYREEHDEKKGRMGRSLLNEKSRSFHVPSSGSRTLLRRPKTDPNIFSFQKMNKTISLSEVVPGQVRKLLLNVNIQKSLGAVQVVMSEESTVSDLIVAVVRRYAKEERRPFLPTTDPSCFGLHYSTFTLESLDREEKLITLGSRNFFLCLSNSARSGVGSGSGSSSGCVGITKTTSSSSSGSSCSNQVDQRAPTFIDLPWLRFTQFMM